MELGQHGSVDAGRLVWGRTGTTVVIGVVIAMEVQIRVDVLVHLSSLKLGLEPMGRQCRGHGVGRSREGDRVSCRHRDTPGRYSS